MKKKAPSYQTQELREFAEVLRGRRTIELFLQTEVPRSLVNEAIEAATWAPNHHVTEPWHFYLLGDETKERCLDLCREIVTAKMVKRPATSNVRAGLKSRAGWW